MLWLDVDTFTQPPALQAQGQGQAAWAVPPERRGKFLGVLGTWPGCVHACMHGRPSKRQAGHGACMLVLALHGPGLMWLTCAAR